MSLRPSYPDVGVAHGFQYLHEATGQRFVRPVLAVLFDEVAKFHAANSFNFSSDEFDDNVCRNTPNIVCTDGIRGIGDVVHQVLNPIAKLVDSFAGTNLEGCGGCYKRQNAMNK